MRIHEHVAALAILIVALPACERREPAPPPPTLTPTLTPPASLPAASAPPVDPNAGAINTSAKNTDVSKTRSKASFHCVELDVDGCTAKCNDDDKLSCYRLAKIFDQSNPARTRQGLEKLCSAEFPLGLACRDLGAMFVEGRGGAKDPARGAELLKKGLAGAIVECKEGHADSCYALRLVYDLGKEVPKDAAAARELEERAIWLYSEACEVGDAYACSRFGHLTLPLGSSDAPFALERGCKLGDPFACETLGLRYTKGDPAKAREHFVRACNGGLTKACPQK